MSCSLSGKTVAVLATDGFTQSELTEPKRLLIALRATVVPENGCSKMRIFDIEGHRASDEARSDHAYDAAHTVRISFSLAAISSSTFLTAASVSFCTAPS